MKVVKSGKIVVIVLILAVALLAFIGSVSYKQIPALRQSANMVAHTLRVETEINRLFSQYAAMQSKVFERKLLAKDKSYDALSIQKDSAAATLKKLFHLTDDNLDQQKNLRSVSAIQDTFYAALNAFNTNQLNISSEQIDYTPVITSISNSYDRLTAIKTNMLLTEETLLQQRQNAYEELRYFTPVMTLLLGMFALLVFLFAFWQINQQLKVNKTTKEFLESVLKNTENIVNYFIPVTDQRNKITDFKMMYSNENIRDILDETNIALEGRLMSEIFPFNFENGVFDALVNCYTTEKIQRFEKNYHLNNKDFRFKTVVLKLNNGVLLTSRDTTDENKTSNDLTFAKNQLETQNLLLLDNRAFLNNIFKSIPNIIIHFKSIRDDSEQIVDFEILYINDAISEVTGDIPAELKNKKASESYPDIFENGIFENLVLCIEEERQIEYESHYDKNGKKLWFQAKAIKLNDGVTVTSRDVTDEKMKANLQIRLNEELQIQNAILNEAEGLAKVGSYLWNTDTFEWQLSDNFYRILGCKPQEFIGSNENFEVFVHPDDLEKYRQQGEQILKENKIITHDYRIITKTKKIRHLRTNGHFEKRDGSNIVVGVVQDITKAVKAEQRLRNKNEELKRSNAELESFNRVASHDLQEPMRKIQMFISRLSEKEVENLSEKGKVYFEKINSSANRMQSLIKYLLAYSRINKTDKAFVPVALNETVDKVLEDLEERIREGNVEISVDELQTINAIPFQMEQLFNNLISNAIKYRSTTEQPKIVIDCNKLSRTKIPDDFDKKHKTYFRISVMDNGIGFDQENAEKIFGLFERLHQREEYSGTGIGLAICKKIVLNHNGYIVAESQKAKGTTFCIYLPV